MVDEDDPMGAVLSGGEGAAGSLPLPLRELDGGGGINSSSSQRYVDVEAGRGLAGSLSSRIVTKSGKDGGASLTFGEAKSSGKARGSSGMMVTNPTSMAWRDDVAKPLSEDAACSVGGKWNWGDAADPVASLVCQ